MYCEQGLADSAGLDFHERNLWRSEGKELVFDSRFCQIDSILDSNDLPWLRNECPDGHNAWQTKPDYTKCIDIATTASLREMIAPGVLVILSPILVGTFGGVEAVSGLLAGAIVSSVQVRDGICSDFCTS